jgi:kynurenine 3-monooxygenase
MHTGDGAPHTAVVGAGLVGALLSVFLARHGLRVDLYDHRHDLRTTASARGRSINLALSTRGLYALRQVGLEDAILRISVPMRGRFIHPPTGEPFLVGYGTRASDVIHSVSRSDLNRALLEQAGRHASIHMHFRKRCTGFDHSTGLVTFQDEDDGTIYVLQHPTLFAADGAGSAIRTHMLSRPRVNYSQTYLDHGYKELTLPSDNGRHRLDPHALHIWPRGAYMMIALPNLDGSFTKDPSVSVRSRTPEISDRSSTPSSAMRYRFSRISPRNSSKTPPERSPQ